MENRKDDKIYALELEVEYLKSIIKGLELELFKIRCLSPNNKLKSNSKKVELLSVLKELKSKTSKTLKDKENIYILEMVLKNMK
jgi:hypothetical protein